MKGGEKRGKKNENGLQNLKFMKRKRWHGREKRGRPIAPCSSHAQGVFGAMPAARK